MSRFVRTFSCLLSSSLACTSTGGSDDEGETAGSASSSSEAGSESTASEGSTDSSSSSSTSEDGTSEDGTSGDGDGDGDGDGCPAASLGAELGASGLMIGGSMSDDSFGTTDFDLRYLYIAGSVPSGGPCTDCANGCLVDGSSCDNANGCNWWGCWQYDQDPPGQYVPNFIASAEAGGAVPMFSYYVWFSVAGGVEGDAEIEALDDGPRVASYLADWRFMMQQIDGATDGPVIVHVEPDLWGYGQQYDADPTQIPVAVSSAGASECAGLGDHFAGFAQCMLAIARAEASNVKVGFHASAWATGIDAYLNTDGGFDLAGDAQQTANYMAALGADEADLVIVEMSDRDAGFNGRWWDADDQALPHFAQAMSWAEGVGQGMGLAHLWWQVPYGNPDLEDACDRYSDNRVDYVFDHPERFAESGSLGVAFGAGAGCMTTAETDDGHFLERAATYFSAAPPAFCGG